MANKEFNSALACPTTGCSGALSRTGRIQTDIGYSDYNKNLVTEDYHCSTCGKGYQRSYKWETVENMRKSPPLSMESLQDLLTKLTGILSGEREKTEVSHLTQALTTLLPGSKIEVERKGPTCLKITIC
jgi:hypothetical protein